MSIRPTDAHKLWGRAGARCSLCRDQLTAVESEGTLGEMAHIVSRSPSGPRGSSQLTRAERDRYANLILLCPTDHVRVDSVELELWSVAKLLQAKADHEKWVDAQIERGVLQPVVANA